MIGLHLLLTLVCSGDPLSRSPFITPYEQVPQGRLAPETVFRAQSPATIMHSGVPLSQDPSSSSAVPIPTFDCPVSTTSEAYSLYQGTQPPYITPDPFAPSYDSANPWTSPTVPGYSPYAPFGSSYGGMFGPQPYRFGLVPRLDVSYIPEADLENINAGVEMFDVDTEFRYNSPFSYGWVLTQAFQFNYRNWSFAGPGIPLSDLNLYRFAWDLRLVTPEVLGWQWEFGFNPSINTDFEHRLTSDAWNFDGHMMAFYRIDPTTQLVLGVGYWDRRDDVVIPYAGLILMPTDRWELRLLFPKARISYFLGNFGGGNHWIYVTGEYRVESYQIEIPTIVDRSQIQYEDWRLALGIRSDHGFFDKYLEVAWVLGRNVEFRRGLPKYDVDDGVMIRAGIRF